MSNLSPEEEEARKRAIFESMSDRRRKQLLKKKGGYDKWDPFQEPKDPIDIRKDKSKRTTQQLIREFLQAIPADEYSNAYAHGALELALGIINQEERFLGMYDFAVWYRELLQREGLDE